MLYVTLITPSPAKSVSVYDADLLGNLLHMEALIGTLVKYGSKGVYEPYFAKSWTINKQNTQFKFIIKNGLFDEKGEALNAESYYKSLHILLKKYAETTEPPIFSSLIGWEDFKSGKSDSISGLKFDSKNNFISFHFEKSAAGLMEFLAMPYYGFYNANDFEITGSWKNSKTITSTGSYRLIELTENKIVIKKRLEFALSNARSYENITIETNANHKIQDIQSHQLFIHNTDLEFDENIKSITTFKSTPTFLYTYEINPKSKIFSVESSRRKFFNLLKKTTENIVQKNTNYIPAVGFYNDDLRVTLLKQDSFEETNSITFLKKKNAQPTKLDFISNQVIDSLKSNGLNITVKDNVPGEGYVKSVEFNDSFDFRIKSVDIGYSPENWVIKMMFCSNLGITFPDPDSQIKKLTENYDKGMFAEESEYAAAFEKILLDQAYLVPIFRDGFSFSTTENVDSDSISRTTNVPRVDLIAPK